MTNKPKSYRSEEKKGTVLKEAMLADYLGFTSPVDMLFARLFEFIGLPKPRGKDPLESDLIPLIRKGLAKKNLEKLMHSTGLDLSAMSGILHVSTRTLHRYTGESILNPDISERLLEIARLYARGQEVFGDLDSFKGWIQEPVPALGYKKPLEYLDTSIGIRLLQDELGRIEHGVFS